MGKMSSVDAYERRLNARAIISTVCFIGAAGGMTLFLGFGAAVAFFAFPVATLTFAGAAMLALALAIVFAP